MIHIKSSSVFIFPLILSCLSSCAGEDRSGERPLVPVVETLEAEVVADSCRMSGIVSESHNRSLRECGFVYGTADTINVKVEADTVSYAFTVVADSLQDGEYYYAAYARNGIGTTYGDTLYFTVNNKKK